MKPLKAYIFLFNASSLAYPYRKLLKSCVFADWALFLNVQVRDELRKETLQLASELYILFI